MDLQDNSSDSDKYREPTLAWIKKSGYPLEMEVARKFHRAEIFIDVSRQYEDLLEKVNRETDVVASWPIFGKRSEDGKSVRFAEFHFVVECKSTGAPWAAFLHDTENMEEYDESLIMADMPNNFGNLEVPACAHAAYENLEPFSKFKNLSYAIRQKKNDDKPGGDKAYNALRQAASAALGLSARSDQLPELFIPLVVINSPLYECFLTSSGELDLRQTKFASQIVNLSDELSALVLISHIDGLDKLISDMQGVVDSYAQNERVFREPWIPERIQDYYPPSVFESRYAPAIYVRKFLLDLQSVLHDPPPLTE
ncbi:hypothetical protein [Streptosporangium canum]|uniref:hypothetical protein n=1 Tax=Streptosporangium canum TaxID=324952 RepID=UPI0037B72ECF